MATVIPYQRFAMARNRQLRGQAVRNLCAIIRTAHEISFALAEVERFFQHQHETLRRADCRHAEAYRLCLRCQEIAELKDPEEMVRQRDVVLRQWVQLNEGDR